MGAIPTPSFLLLCLFFLISSTPFPVSSDPGPPALKTCNKDDLKALVAFRDSFGSPNPFPSWDLSFPCWDWYGVVTDENNGRVYELNIIQISEVTHIPPVTGDLPFLQYIIFHDLPNLTGPIPPEITKLKRLRFLTISWTALSGPVPSFLSKLQKLEQLDLSFNRITGSIPPSLGDLPNCNVINISHNSLTGTIPATLSKLQKLESLDLSFNRITGSILPSLGDFPNCFAIDISRNNLTGTIPASLFSKTGGAEQPSYLVLSHNQLTGEIPRSFGYFNFSRFDLSRNRLTGDASFLFGRSRTVETLDLSRNQFEFDLSKVEFPLIDLASVDLSHNKIYGSIPSQIVESNNNNIFNFFNVSYNRLCGKIPTGGQMSEFDASRYIHNKCLCGAPLPSCK